MANTSGHNVSVLLGNGDGTFLARVDYGDGGGPWSVAIGDLNGDEDPDLAVANSGGDNVSVLLNNGDGTFQARVDYGAGDGAYSVAIGDLNGDENPDLAVANSGGDNVLMDRISVLINVGPCATSGAPSLASPSNRATNVPTTPTLSWAAIPDATSYDLQVCSDSVCSSVMRSINVTTGQWMDSAGLDMNTTYWWHVRADNACGSGQWSSTWSFTTGNCFIATAAFGTSMEGKIDLLRSFRDAYLLKTPYGEALVSAYYKYSPPVANYIAQRGWLRAVVRILLLPVIGFVSLLA